MIRYFKAINNDTKHEIYFVNETIEGAQAHLNDLNTVGSFSLVETTKEETYAYLEANDCQTDIFINVGTDKENMEYYEPAYTNLEAIERAKELATDYEFVEVIWEPKFSDTIREVLWKNF